MGLFTTTDDKHLEAARQLVAPGDCVCPHCAAPFAVSGKTLVQWNGSLGIEGHRCTACGQIMTRRRPSPDGL